MKIALAVEYNGGAFHGWQAQKDNSTVQDSVEAALSRVADAPVRVYAAGRTDAGVHAVLMPVHFCPTIRRQPSAWVRGGNAHLPPAIKILWAKPVRADFHARYSCQRRYYQYIILNRSVPPGVLAEHVGTCHVPLNLTAMRQAARALRGEHDFSAFRAAACQAKTPVRHLYSLRIHKQGDFITFSFCGNGFLHHMVRNIIGTLVEIGRGRQPPQWARTLLSGGDRRQAAKTAAASGLYFNGALYDSAYKLPPCRLAAPLGNAPLAD